jgi:hypothetical protein
VPSAPRDMNATWCSLGTLCRERGWSQPRAIYELQRGLRFRTVPPGHEHEIDWHDPNQLSRLDLSASTMEIWQGVAAVEGTVAPCFLTVGIEVLPPTDVVSERKPKPKRKPKRKPAKKVSPAAVERCFRDIMRERPNDPPDEEWLLPEMTRRLGASPIRERVRSLWKDIAPEWKRPRGHPRNFNSAKKSAV